MNNKDLKSIDTTAKFSNFEVLNPDFTRCKCNMFYLGENRNFSIFTEEALQKFIDRKGYANIPIIGHIKQNKNGKKIMGSHDRRIEITNEEIREINECSAYGVIPEDCNPRMEKIIDVHGIEREYFTVDVILWSHYFPEVMETAYSDEVYFNQSVEISILDADYQNQYLVIKDFSLQALCMLGKYDGSHGNGDESDNSEPCFEDSRIRRFSLNEDKFKQNFELMLEKLKQYETGESPVEDNQTKKEGETSMNFKKFVEILSAQKIEGSDNAKYALLNVDDSKVFALDMEDYKPYGFNYAITTAEDNAEDIIVDFESKAEMSLSAVEKITDEDFTEFSIKSAIDMEADRLAEIKTSECTAVLEGEFNKKVDELKSCYEDLSNAHAIATKKLDEYEAKEAQAKADKHEADVIATFEKYSEKLGKCSEFLVYKAKCVPADVTLDELNEKLALMLGKYTMDTNTKKNFSYTPIETKVSAHSDDNGTSKYGHLLDKFIK